MSLGDATFATHMSCIHGSQYSDHDISDRVVAESNGYCEDDNFNTDDYISDDGGFNYYEDHSGSGGGDVLYYDDDNFEDDEDHSSINSNVNSDNDVDTDDDEDDGDYDDDDEDDDDDETMDHSESNSSYSIMRFILMLFFRIIYKYNISNNAASKILALISFILGMLFDH